MPTCPEPAEGVPTVLRAVEKLNILSTSIGSVIPEGAKSACGGESRKNNILLDTGSRLRLARYDVCSRFQAFSAACYALCPMPHTICKKKRAQIGPVLDFRKIGLG